MVSPEQGMAARGRAMPNPHKGGRRVGFLNLLRLTTELVGWQAPRVAARSFSENHLAARFFSEDSCDSEKNRSN
jgi:hypothetical protein